MARASGGSPIDTPCTIANARVASATSAPARSNARTPEAVPAAALQSAPERRSSLRPTACDVGAAPVHSPPSLALDAHAVGHRLARPGQAAADDERFQIGGDGRMLDAHRQPRRRRGRARGRRRVEPDAARVQGGAAGDDGHRIDAGGDAAVEQVADARRAAPASASGRPTSTTRATSSAVRWFLASRLRTAVRPRRDERLRQRVQLVARDRFRARGAAAAGAVGQRQSSRGRRATARSSPARRRPAAAPAPRRESIGRAAVAPRQRRGRPLAHARRRCPCRPGSCRPSDRPRAAGPRAVSSNETSSVPPPRSNTSQVPLFVALVGAPAGRDRAGDRLLDQHDLLEPRQAPGPRRRVVLRQLEQRGRRDHRRARLEPGTSRTSASSDAITAADSSSGNSAAPGRLEPTAARRSPSAASTPPRVFAGSPSRPRTARRPTDRPPRASMPTTDGVSVSPSGVGDDA